MKGKEIDIDKMLKDKHTALHFPTFRTAARIQKLIASMPYDYAFREWKLHTLRDMAWNENHQSPNKYWS